MLTKPDRRRTPGLVSGAAAGFIAMIVVLGPPATPSCASASAALPPSGDLESIPGASADWWAQVREDLECAAYAATSTATGLQAPNLAHDFRAHYREAMVEVVPRGGDPAAAWSLSWRTARVGRPGRMREIAPTAAELRGSRVLYAHPGIVEWYENRADGLEQGFTVEERPAGEGPLTIVGCVGGALKAELSHDGTVGLMDAHGRCVLRYGGLVVWDGVGREIGSRLEVAGNELAILVDDEAGAAYPITVDPVLTSPSWNGEGNQSEAFYGISVATAGDVNGDGFSDVVVGASSYDGGEVNEGRAFLYLGSPNGLSSTAAWTSESNQAGAAWGGRVGTAGDVNGDGYDDVIVVSSAYDGAEIDEGLAAVFLGSSSGLAAAPAWIAGSDQVDGSLGSGGTAGDVNGDGYDDVILGAAFYDNGQVDEGRAFVYHGSPAGLSSTSAWTAEVNQAQAAFGISVGTAGDVNGDGYDDVVVGALWFDNGQTDEGRAFVYHGSPSGLAGSPSWIAESNQADANFGVAVSLAGDVNGDGYGDVIVGANTFDGGQVNCGRCFGYFGSASGLSPNAAWVVEPEPLQYNAFFGSAIGTAGDVNGDGYADVIVGAQGMDAFEGWVFIYQGSAGGLSLHPDWTMDRNQTGVRLGQSVATAGDVNGDGYSDVIAGAPYANGNHQPHEGHAFVFHGSPASLTASAVWTGEPNQVGASFGQSVATAGDVNGDGYSDVIVSALWYDDGEEDEGAAFVYHGSASGLSSTPDWWAESNQASANVWTAAEAGDVNGDGYSDVIVGYPNYNWGRAEVYYGSPSGLETTPSWIAEPDAPSIFGYSVATAGDVNGDGYSDVIIGAYGYSNGENSEGRAFVYHGSASGLEAEPAWFAESNHYLGEFGYSVASAGDVNGDGYSDVVVGAFGWDNPETNEGEAFVYLGSPTGLSDDYAWRQESNNVEANFGTSVASAGDVNGDGYSDVIIGANHFSNGQHWEGRVFVFHGGSEGLYSAPSWWVESDQADAYLGYWVGSAGDVNRDGFSDVVVGAYRYDNDQPNEGRVWLYLGSPAGLQSSPVWWDESDQAQGQFGKALGTAGDVNGDGFSDVVIGSNNFSNGQDSEGRAWLYYGNGGDGLDRIARQARVDDTAPIATLGLSDSPSGFRLRAVGRTPAGRGMVRLQYEVEPFGMPLDGDHILQGPFVDTGEPGPNGSAVNLGRDPGDLEGGSLYHWRLRVAADSPFFPRSPWLTLPYNAASEADFRTAVAVDVGEAEGPSPVLGLGPSAPNPFSAGTRFSYTLPHAARRRIAVYDVQGRQVALLADSRERAGRHVLQWDGRDDAGQELPAGAYFLQLELDGGVRAVRKIILVR
jgi:hypothetical protein